MADMLRLTRSNKTLMFTKMHMSQPSLNSWLRKEKSLSNTQKPGGSSLNQDSSKLITKRELLLQLSN